MKSRLQNNLSIWFSLLYGLKEIENFYLIDKHSGAHYVVKNGLAKYWIHYTICKENLLELFLYLDFFLFHKPSLSAVNDAFGVL